MCEGELRWLYTGRNGLVAKKKGAADRDLIERHFMEAALANPQNITKRVATVQHKDGEGYTPARAGKYCRSRGEMKEAHSIYMCTFASIYAYMRTCDRMLYLVWTHRLTSVLHAQAGSAS